LATRLIRRDAPRDCVPVRRQSTRIHRERMCSGASIRVPIVAITHLSSSDSPEEEANENVETFTDGLGGALAGGLGGAVFGPAGIIVGMAAGALLGGSYGKSGRGTRTEASDGCSVPEGEIPGHYREDGPGRFVHRFDRRSRRTWMWFGVEVGTGVLGVVIADPGTLFDLGERLGDRLAHFAGHRPGVFALILPKGRLQPY